MKPLTKNSIVSLITGLILTIVSLAYSPDYFVKYDPNVVLDWCSQGRGFPLQYTLSCYYSIPSSILGFIGDWFFWSLIIFVIIFIIKKLRGKNG